MPGIACLPVLLVAVIIRCDITHTSLECPALDAPGPPPGNGHLQAGLIAVSTHTKAAFNDLSFFPYVVCKTASLPSGLCQRSCSRTTQGLRQRLSTEDHSASCGGNCMARKQNGMTQRCVCECVRVCVCVCGSKCVLGVSVCVCVYMYK